jgi:hypothetical protein
MYKAEVRFSYGHVDYESTGSGTSEDIPDLVFEGRLVGGKDLKVFSDSRLTPYLGIGFRYLNDDSGGKRSSLGDYGYERESRYLYIPIGVEFTTRMAEGWLLSPTFEYDLFISGTQRSQLSDVSPIYPDIKNNQDHGFGLRGSLKFIKEAKPVSFIFEPYIRYWHIEDSDVDIIWYEPENKTTEIGVRLGAQF